jgi:hypothetical protein
MTTCTTSIVGPKGVGQAHVGQAHVGQAHVGQAQWRAEDTSRRTPSKISTRTDTPIAVGLSFKHLKSVFIDNKITDGLLRFGATNENFRKMLGGVITIVFFIGLFYLVCSAGSLVVGYETQAKIAGTVVAAFIAKMRLKKEADIAKMGLNKEAEGSEDRILKGKEIRECKVTTGSSSYFSSSSSSSSSSCSSCSSCSSRYSRSIPNGGGESSSPSISQEPLRESAAGPAEDGEKSSIGTSDGSSSECVTAEKSVKTKKKKKKKTEKRAEKPERSNTSMTISLLK